MTLSRLAGLFPLAALTLVLVSAAPAGRNHFSYQSWFDANHGWRANRSAVYSTENGGRSWHRIFVRPIGIERIARISPTSGAIAGYRARFWTADNGRLWHVTKRIGRKFEGRGNQFFFIGGRTDEALFQVVPWPPRREVRRDMVAKLKVGRFAEIQPVPGGIAAAIDIGERSPYLPKIFLRRYGQSRLIRLPHSGLGTCNVVGFTVSWPSMTVVGQPRLTGGDCGSSVNGAIMWWTGDAGETWWSTGGD